MMRILGWVVGVIVAIFAVIMATGAVIARNNEPKVEALRKECANEIYWAAKYSKTPDDLDALVRSRPYARKVCDGFQVNGVDVIR